jgi:uncharacterized protein (DUF983 family)
MLMRGFLKHCPRCGSGHLFTSWFDIRATCPRCGLLFEREEGYWVGAMAMAIGITELLFAVLLTIAVIATWPEIPVWPIVAAGVAINLFFPIFYYPFTKTIWLAVDLAFFHPEAARSEGSDPARPRR